MENYSRHRKTWILYRIYFSLKKTEVTDAKTKQTVKVKTDMEGWSR